MISKRRFSALMECNVTTTQQTSHQPVDRRSLQIRGSTTGKAPNPVGDSWQPDRRHNKIKINNQ